MHIYCAFIQNALMFNMRLCSTCVHVQYASTFNMQKWPWKKCVRNRYLSFRSQILKNSEKYKMALIRWSSKFVGENVTQPVLISCYWTRVKPNNCAIVLCVLLRFLLSGILVYLSSLKCQQCSESSQDESVVRPGIPEQGERLWAYWHNEQPRLVPLSRATLCP